MPPHAFELAADGLRYAGFRRRNGTLDLTEQRRAELPAETFQPGVLGGPLRHAEALRATLKALLEGLPEAVEEASLVLPDAWMRLSVLEVGDLPPSPDKREDVLRWKLKRVVPVSVEELRLAATELSGPAGRDEEGGRQVLVAFALESLLAQTEAAFAAEGVRLGWISNRSLSLLESLRPDLRSAELLVLAVAAPEGATLLASRSGEPVLHRFKAAAQAAPASALVERDLRLTRSFLEQHYPGARLEQALLVAPEEVQEGWRGLLEGVFGAASPLGGAHVVARAGGVAWSDVAPLAGAAAREVHP